MDMEMDVKDELGLADGLVDRLVAAAGVLEQAADRLAGLELEAAGGRASARESELEGRLREAEATIVQLRASGAGLRVSGAGRRTIAAGAMASKDGVGVEAGALDAALVSLSLEQRIAVKAQMLRSGLIG